MEMFFRKKKMPKPMQHPAPEEQKSPATAQVTTIARRKNEYCRDSK